MKKDLVIGICDDDEMSIISIQGFVKSFLDKEGIYADIMTFKNTDDLFIALKSQMFDLLFLDIDIGESDGIAFAKKIRKLYLDVALVFVSSHEERVYESIEVNPLAFVRKDKFISDFSTLLNRFHSIFEEIIKREQVIVVQVQNQGPYKVSLDHILYFEGNMHYQFMYETSQKEPKVIASKMKTLEEELRSKDFMRIQKGYLVNMKHVIKIEKQEVVMSGGTRLPVSRNMIKKIREQMLQYNMEHHAMIL